MQFQFDYSPQEFDIIKTTITTFFFHGLNLYDLSPRSVLLSVWAASANETKDVIKNHVLKSWKDQNLGVLDVIP